MAELQQTRYDKFIRRVANIVGAGAIVTETLQEVFPTIDVETQVGELMLLGGTQICFGGGLILGAAGEAGKAQLFNPVNSGKIITLTAVRATLTGTSIFRWGISSVTALTTHLQTQVLRDTRGLPPARPTGEIRVQSAVALAAGTNQVRLLSSVILQLQEENGVAVLLPGTGFEMGPSNNILTLNFSFSWRERTLEAAEINL